MSEALMFMSDVIWCRNSVTYSTDRCAMQGWGNEQIAMCSGKIAVLYSSAQFK